MAYFVNCKNEPSIKYIFIMAKKSLDFYPHLIFHTKPSLCRNRRSVSLEFRTRLPHALLVYHGIRNRPASMNKYELYVMLDQGQLKIKHLFGDFSTTLEVGKGLNRDKWHIVTVMIDPSNGVISATVDNHDQKTMIIDGLKEHPLYGADNEELESIIFIGGKCCFCNRFGHFCHNSCDMFH
jgi:hypothetical protein